MAAEDPQSKESKAEPRGRSPCLVVAAAFGLGIAADHACDLPRLALFVTATLVTAILLSSALLVGRQATRSIRVALLIVLYAALGATAHHAAWNDRGLDSITRLTGTKPRLVRLTGSVCSSPVILRRRESGRKAAWPLEDQTRVLIDVESLKDQASPEPVVVSGRVQLTTSGHLIHIGYGDRIELVGWLSRPGAPRNPGGFDAATYFRQHGIDALVHADHPDSVQRLGSPRFHWQRAISRVRDQLAVLFAEHLGPRNSPVGAAMILGDRSAMPLDIRDGYVTSGAMHILSISGLHVGILAMFLAAVGRVSNLSAVATGLGLTLCIWLYAVFTNLDPPVVRASLFLTIWAIAAFLGRPALLLNMTAATAFILLLRDPLSLFDVGAQLSFLAVLGMNWSLRMFPRADSFLSGTGETLGWIGRSARSFLAVQLLGIGIWLFTAPLLAEVFGIVSPVGLLLNIVLIPLVTLVMWSGYVFFALCLLASEVVGPFAFVFDLGLTCVDWLVMTAGNWRLGHARAPGSPGWWLVVFYGLLFASLVRPALAGRRLRTLSLLLGWIAIGLGIGIAATRGSTGELRVVVLDVGHGGAVLVETPVGRTLLFDCGSMEDDRYAAEATWSALCEAGHGSLDAVVISHADLDHCNNAPRLFRSGPVGSMLVGRSFLNFDQPAVADACHAARMAGVPVRLVAAGDVLQLDPKVEMTLLHPPDRPFGEDDNANSIVLRIEYAGRSVILTGDVEGTGQEELFAYDPAGGCDLVVAPHHGGRKANTPRFAEWARPQAVIVSCSDRVNAATLSEIYAGSQLYLTSEHGAVIATIDADGRIDYRTLCGPEQTVHSERAATRRTGDVR